MSMLSRRGFLAASAALPAVPAWAAADEPIAFFVVGDTHYFADPMNSARVDAKSAATNNGLIDALNRLPGTAIPAEAGGGTVRPIRGVLHAGDCIDSGDKPKLAQQQTEWAAFAEGFGLDGKDGRLKFPVFEVHGNHDSPRGDGLAVKKIVERNRKRPGLTNVSDNGVCCSWDWGPVHFVTLGLVVGQNAAVARPRRYNPLDSLAFLAADLKKHVGASGRPVVALHHVDMIRYAKPLPVADQAAAKMEWDPADVQGYFAALQTYNLAAVFYGHTHARNIFRWDGGERRAAAGVPVFNVDNGAHYKFGPQAFYYVEIAPRLVTVREYHTSDSWQTGAWTPQSWTVPLPARA